MKIFRLFLIVSVAITIGYFSWNYYTGRLLQEKHERARLVYMEFCNGMGVSCLEVF